jgi:hypothetical protein
VYRIPAGADGPGDARHIVDEEFADVLPESVRERVKLLVSEFVTNRIVAGRADREDDELILDLRAEDVVRCTFVDHGSAAVPPQCVLGVLDQLSLRWGLTRTREVARSRTREVTRVWFEAETG